MTVALAARFPWGRLRKVVTSLPGSRFPSAVILMADSRWTYEGFPPEDMGQKVCAVAPERGIGAVFAGDVWAAEEAFELTRQKLEGIEIRPNAVASLASSTLKHVYAAHASRRARRASVEPLYAIVGMANRLGQSALIYLSSASGFRPLFVDGVVALGWPTACDKLRETLPQVEEELLPGHGTWELNVDIWAMGLAAHLYHGVIEPAQEPRVGGWVQFAVLSQEGWKEFQVDTTSGDPMDASSWQPVTIERRQLKSYRGVWKVPRLASGEFHLQAEKVSS